jgi:hypothetical protein
LAGPTRPRAATPLSPAAIATFNGLNVVNGSGTDDAEPSFWTVEYLYTYGNPAAGSLSTSFLNFLNTSTAKDILRSQDYTPCMDRGESLLGTLCP